MAGSQASVTARYTFGKFSCCDPTKKKADSLLTLFLSKKLRSPRRIFICRNQRPSMECWLSHSTEAMPTMSSENASAPLSSPPADFGHFRLSFQHFSLWRHQKPRKPSLPYSSMTTVMGPRLLLWWIARNCVRRQTIDQSTSWHQQKIVARVWKWEKFPNHRQPGKFQRIPPQAN